MSASASGVLFGTQGNNQPNLTCDIPWRFFFISTSLWIHMDYIHM